MGPFALAIYRNQSHFRPDLARVPIHSLSIIVVVQLSIQAPVADLEFIVAIDFDINDLAESTVKPFAGFFVANLPFFLKYRRLELCRIHVA